FRLMSCCSAILDLHSFPTRRSSDLASTTLTILVSVASFPDSSDTVYTTSYSPTVEVSTSPETSIASDTSPSTSSSAVAPGSSYVEPTSNSIGLSPFKEITGATVSSGSGSSPLPSASTTLTILVSVASFPAASDTV